MTSMLEKFTQTKRRQRQLDEQERAAGSGGTDTAQTKKYAKGGKVSAFGSAFAEARKAGKKEFEYEGKKYTTETSEEAAKRRESKVESRNRDATEAYHKREKDKLSDTASALYKAKHSAPEGTSKLAMQKIDEAASSTAKRAATYDKERGMESYKPRRPGTSLQSVRGMGANYENPDATSETFKKGGTVSRGYGLARAGKKCKMV
jgi:hypothetical protein